MEKNNAVALIVKKVKLNDNDNLLIFDSLKDGFYNPETNVFFSDCTYYLSSENEEENVYLEAVYGKDNQEYLENKEEWRKYLLGLIQDAFILTHTYEDGEISLNPISISDVLEPQPTNEEIYNTLIAGSYTLDELKHLREYYDSIIADAEAMQDVIDEQIGLEAKRPKLLN